jgi:hypothetical protein
MTADEPDEQDELIGDAMALGGPAFVQELRYIAREAAAQVPWDGRGPAPPEYTQAWLASSETAVDAGRATRAAIKLIQQTGLGDLARQDHERSIDPLRRPGNLGGLAMDVIGTIWAQDVLYSIVAGSVKTQTHHVFPSRRHITTDSAISLIVTDDDLNWAETGVSQIVSNGINETFDPPLPAIHRTNVTEITFRTSSSQNRVHAQHVINYWQ